MPGAPHGGSGACRDGPAVRTRRPAAGGAGQRSQRRPSGRSPRGLVFPLASPGQTSHCTLSPARAGELLCFGVGPLGGDSSRTAYVQVLGCGDSGCIETARPVVVQRALFSFVRGETRELVMMLADRCRNAGCGDQERCVPATGQCAPVLVEPGQLLPLGGTDAGGGWAVDAENAATEGTADASDVMGMPEVSEGDTGVEPRDSGVEVDASEVVNAPDVPAVMDAGPCGGRCRAGETCCAEACVDLRTSDTNCGACGNACAATTRCAIGLCLMRDNSPRPRCLAPIVSALQGPRSHPHRPCSKQEHRGRDYLNTGPDVPSGAKASHARGARDTVRSSTALGHRAGTPAPSAASGSVSPFSTSHFAGGDGGGSTMGSPS